MAELIERDLLCHSLAQHLVQGLHGQNVDLEEAMKGHHIPSYRMGFEYAMNFAQTIVSNRPTTTEAEIRAKAIDEFAKALLTNEVVDKSVVRRVAEQLKEEQ